MAVRVDDIAHDAARTLGFQVVDDFARFFREGQGVDQDCAIGSQHYSGGYLRILGAGEYAHIVGDSVSFHILFLIRQGNNSILQEAMSRAASFDRLRMRRWTADGRRKTEDDGRTRRLMVKG